MIKEIKIPEIAENVDSAIVTEVLVAPGDHIEEEQSIITVETDKASVEIPTSASGAVQEVKVDEGDEVQVGTVILTLETEEDTGEDAEEKKEKKTKPKDPPAERSKKDGTKAEKETDAEYAAPSSSREAPASPLARRVARELDVDIDQVEGSGPGGRITEEDVRARARSKSNGEEEKKEKTTEPSPKKTTGLPDFSQWGEVSRERIGNIRKAIADKTPESWRLIPHVTHFEKANLTLAEAFMDENAAKVEKAGGKLTITAILVKLVAEALKNFPAFNASLDMENEEIIYRHYYHIGLAVDTDDGLLLPIVRDVDQKTIVEAAVEIASLAEKARNKELSPEEMQGGCFTVTNLGGIGGTNFTPLIYHPQVAILGISRAAIEPVYVDGHFEPQAMLPLSLSYDHRLIDGASAARFMKWLAQALENPLSVFMN